MVRGRRREFNGQSGYVGPMRVPWSEPFTRFAAVFEQARVAHPKDPNAMTLATVDAQGRPSLRVVLLKDFDEQGFVFYTNHASRKGREALSTKAVALNFYWPSLDTQVRAKAYWMKGLPSKLQNGPGGGNSADR